MLFTKSAPVVSRSAFAAKSKSNKFWASSNQGQNGPGFFVSTPQFNRHQQSQLIVYHEDGRGAGSSGQNSDSYNIDNPYLPLTAGGNTAAAAPGILFDDDAKEEGPQISHRPVKHKQVLNLKPRISLDSVRITPRVVEAADDGRTPSTVLVVSGDDKRADPLAVVIDKADKSELINGVIRKMQRLQSIGSHHAVLDTFEDLEALQANLPIEAYNIVLMSLASTGDASTLLEGYERLLARGLFPNESTYVIVLTALADIATSLSTKRSQLLPLLGEGTDVLESVDEIREGLPVEEHLMVALAILQPVISSHPKPLQIELQLIMDRIVSLCINNNVEVPVGLLEGVSSSVLATIKLEPTIGAAAAKFSSLRPDQQQSEAAQVALLSSYFQHKEPAGAMAFFSSCGAPQYLIKPLLMGMASVGLVGLSRRWLTEFNSDQSIINAVLRSVPISQAKDVLPSATTIFYQLISKEGRESLHQSGTGGSGGSPDDSTSNIMSSEGRCSYLRLCVAAGDSEALYMAIRESKYNDITWDAITITEVINFLIKSQQPLMAADICAWQIPLLASAYSRNEVRSFVEEEIISDTVRNMQQANQLSLNASLRLLPVVLICSQARKQIFEIILAAKLGAPHEIAELVDSVNLPIIVSSLASVLISSTLRGTQEEVDIVSKLLPSFVEDALAARAEFTAAEIADVHEALKQCKSSEPLISLWLKRTSKLSQNVGLKNHSLVSEMSLNITRYALSPNGLDYALELLKDQLRLKEPVSNTAIETVIDACGRCGASDILPELFAIIPLTQPVLNCMGRAAAAVGNTELAIQCHRSLTEKLGVFPTVPTYHSLIASPAMSLDQALEFFTEAKSAARIPLNADIYNAMATRLAESLQKKELASLMAEMHERQLNLYPATYGSIIKMSVKLKEGHQALTMLKSVPTTIKSLLDVKVFNYLMNYFVKSSDRESALEVFVELRNTGTLATPFTYRLLMSAYLIRDQTGEPNLNSADRVLSLMRQDGSPITPECFATLLHARGVLFKDFEAARNFYRGMVKNSRVLPDKSVFEALIKSYITNGKASELDLVLNEMKRYHVAVDGNIARLATTHMS